MTSSGTFTCPACGADFDVQEELGAEGKPKALPVEDPMLAAEQPHEQAVSFQCPECGADYETQETLPGEPETRH